MVYSNTYTYIHLLYVYIKLYLSCQRLSFVGIIQFFLIILTLVEQPLQKTMDRPVAIKQKYPPPPKTNMEPENDGF